MRREALWPTRVRQQPPCWHSGPVSAGSGHLESKEATITGLWSRVVYRHLLADPRRSVTSPCQNHPVDTGSTSSRPDPPLGNSPGRSAPRTAASKAGRAGQGDQIEIVRGPEAG